MESNPSQLPPLALLRALNATFFWTFWSGGFAKILSDIALTINPLLTRHLIAYTMNRYPHGKSSVSGKGIGFALGISFVMLFSSFCINVFFYNSTQTGAQVRAVLANAIYRKNLRLSSKARLEFPNGRITNMMSADCHRIDFSCQWFHFTWSFPIAIGISIALVVTNIGASGLIGFAVLLAVFLIILNSGRMNAKLRRQATKITDIRVSAMREILQAIKIIKFYSWEEAYEKKISRIRSVEMKKIIRMLAIRNFVNALTMAVPTLAGLVSFILLFKTGGSLNPSRIFSSVTIFNVMRLPLMFLPLSMVTTTDAYQAINRIQAFLSASEIEHYTENFEDDSVSFQGDVIQVIDGNFIWETLGSDSSDKSDGTASITDQDDINDDASTIEEKESSKKYPPNTNVITIDHEKNTFATDTTTTGLREDLTKTHSRLAEESSYPIIEPIQSSTQHVPSTEKKDTVIPTVAKIVPEDSASADFSSVTHHQHRIFHGLHNINLNIKRGEFVIITGTIGTGKSSLLAAISGMMHRVSGRVITAGSVLSAGQPWVQNATVRDNITFGKPFDSQWYHDVVTACSLQRDFDILPAGDLTEVGERGITLSGGQKARINLARAVYNNPDIILLDDVLSAVDAHVGKYIMENCICGLMVKKTRILATHQLAMLKFADKVIFLDGSGEAVMGSVVELRASIPSFDSLMTYSDRAEAEDADDLSDAVNLTTSQSQLKEEFILNDPQDVNILKDEQIEKAEKEKKLELSITNDNHGKNISRIATKKSVHDDTENNNNNSPSQENNSGKLIQAEDRATNGVSLDVYKDFVRHGSGGLGWGIVVILLLAILLANFCQVFTNVWLSYWTNHTFPGRSEGFYIGLFVMFGILTALLMFGFFFSITFIGNHTSKNLHMLAVNSIFHAPMSFFDSSPLGRILNRFTHDTDTMDNELSDQTRLFLMSTSLSIAVYILVICYIPWFAIALVGLVSIFLVTSSFYRASAREIKRLDSVCRSRVFARFGESLSGVGTILAYNDQKRFINSMEETIDGMNSAYYLTLTNQRWLSVRLDLIGCATTIIVTILCVTHQFNINPSSVGLVVSSMLQVIPMISLIVREMATVENNMNAVERIHHYAYNLSQEARFHIPETAPAPTWPERGNIEFREVFMSYKPDLPPALKNFSANVKGGEKIGICGRTGAGKSTIMSALYRLVELRSGSILIDGVDTGRIGLHELRSKLSIIPQDPVLFQGTVRSNVDPFGNYSDDELWDALRRAWLVEPSELARVKELEARGISTKDLILKNEGNVKDANGILGEMPKFHLDRSVDDEGTNFSLGERQLLALATALVRNSKILILDEATSNVDFLTDSKIQTTIASEFKECTILCIAHRLHTIIGYDRILVMESGEIAEFESPINLYQQEDSIFRSMCDQSGITIEDF